MDTGVELLQELPGDGSSVNGHAESGRPGDNQASCAADLVRSIAYSSFQAPLNGVVQLVDHFRDSKILPNVQLIAPCKPAEVGTSNWHAQQLGGGIGMAIDFMLASKFTGAVGRTAGGLTGMAPLAEGVAMTEASLAQGQILRSMEKNALVGFAYDFLCTEVKAGDGDFWSARFKHGITGATTFATLGGVSQLPGMRSLSIPLSNALSGIPAGIAHANVSSLLDAKGFASKTDMAQRAYGYFFVGGAMGSIHAAHDKLVGPENISHPSYLTAIGTLAETTGLSHSKALECLTVAAPHTAKLIGRIGAEVNTNTVQSLSALEGLIAPVSGESKTQSMEIVLDQTIAGLDKLHQYQIPMKAITNPAVAEPIYKFLGTDFFSKDSGFRSSARLSLISQAFKSNAPVSLESLLAMERYTQGGGSLKGLDNARIGLATRAYEEFGYFGAKTIDIANSRGYAMHNGEIPWSQLENHSRPYVTGQVTDYRHSGIVGALLEHDIPISRTNIDLARENIVQNGYLDAPQLKPIIEIGESLRNAKSAPKVFEQFARGIAEENGIDTRNMAVGEVLGQLQAINISPSQIVSQVVQIQRAGGGFSDFQLQDPIVIQMLIENSGSGKHPMAPQAINVVTRLLGSSQAQSNFGAVEVVQEFLDYDGKMRDVDLGSLNVAVDLAAARSSMASDNPGWNKVKISPGLVKMVKRDAGYSVADRQMSPDLIDRIISAFNRTPGPRP